MNSASTRPNRAPEIKRALCDVRRLCDALGLTAGGPKTFKKQANGLIVRCPVHNENTPSCSIQLRQGVVLWHCHGCDASGDAISLVAAARGLSMRGAAFRDVLAESARIAGLWAIVRELETGVTDADADCGAVVVPPSRPEAEERPRAYPDDIEAFWVDLLALGSDAEASGYLRGRGIDPEAAESRDLARVIPTGSSLPQWARYRGQTWLETGHRLVVPMFDASGVLHSVRGWRIVDGDSPKRLPPGGHKASELVMVDAWALAWLRGQREPTRIVIAEGEPDYLVWSTRLNDPNTATIGIISGSWCRAFAERVPIGCRVDVRTDRDEAGERYFVEIYGSLRRRTPAVYRALEAA